MDGGVDDVQFLLASVRQEIAALKGDRRLSAAPNDGNRGGALRQHVLDLLGAAEYWLAREPDGEAPDNTREAFSRSLRDLMHSLQAAHSALPWLAATQSPEINLGSLYLAEEFAEILIGKNVDLVIVPDPEYMYATQSWPFADVVDQARRQIGFNPKTRDRPVVLHYPLSDSNRLLLHAIFGHELGHSAVQAGGLVEKVLDNMRDEEYERALGEAGEKIWVRNSPEQTRRSMEARLSSWIEELLCDHLAVDCVGPAYLWAFAGFVLPLSYGFPLPNYPPPTVRIKLVADQLADRGWEGYMEAKAPEVLAWLRKLGSEAGNALPPEFAFLRDQVIRRADLLRATSAERIRANALDPESASEEAEEAAGLLGDLILPLGLDGPLSPRSILLGGWEQALKKHGDEPGGLVAALSDEVLQDLVGKAIEMSVVVSCWEAE